MSLLSDNEVKQEYFGGEALNTVNSITTERLTQIRTKVDEHLWTIMRRAVPTVEDTDVYRDWKRYSYELFQQALDGVKLFLSAKDELKLRRRHAGPGLHWQNPTNYPKT